MNALSKLPHLVSGANGQLIEVESASYEQTRQVVQNYYAPSFEMVRELANVTGERLSSTASRSPMYFYQQAETAIENAIFASALENRVESPFATRSEP